MMKGNPTCATCVFYQPNSAESAGTKNYQNPAWGRCHGGLPKYVESGAFQGEGRWPLVSGEEDWCRYHSMPASAWPSGRGKMTEEELR